MADGDGEGGVVQDGHEMVSSSEHGGDTACEIPKGVLGGDERTTRTGDFGEQRETSPVGVIEEGGFAAGDADEDLGLKRGS